MTNDSTWTLRGYEPSDLDAMFALDIACFAAPFRFSRAAMRRFAEARNARVVLAVSGEELAGFCIVHVETARGVRAGYVVTLDVAEAQRGHGLATLLMAEAERQAVTAGCAAMLLHVWAGNAAAIGLYERLGYSRLHVARAFYGAGLDALVYRKALVSALVSAAPAGE